MQKSSSGLYVGNQWDKGEIPKSDDRLVGIEIEVEDAPGLNLQDPHAVTKHVIPMATSWMQVQDLSLRNNGAEFVSIPLPVSKVSGALAELFEYQKWCSHQWKGSIRTGIHIHVNVRDFRAEHLQNLHVAYPLLEPALFAFVGADREECIYCVPWYRAPGDAKRLASRITDSKMLIKRLWTVSNHLAKYSALYLAPITRIGTVEFRHAPTWLEPEKILRWVRICESIVSYSRNAAGTSDILEAFELNPNTFVNEVTNGLLPAPRNYQQLVSKSGADILAASLFPEVLPEWIRLLDGYIPLRVTKKKKGYSIGDIPQLSPPKYPPLGSSKKLWPSLQVVYWHGPTKGWRTEKYTGTPWAAQDGLAAAPKVSHGDVKWNAELQKFQYWNAVNMEWQANHPNQDPTGMYSAELPPPGQPPVNQGLAAQEFSQIQQSQQSMAQEHHQLMNALHPLQQVAPASSWDSHPYDPETDFS